MLERSTPAEIAVAAGAEYGPPAPVPAVETGDGPRSRILTWMRERLLSCPGIRFRVGRAGGFWVGSAPPDVVLPVCVLRTRVGPDAVSGSLTGLTLQVNFIFEPAAAHRLDECMIDAYFSFSRETLKLDGFEELEPKLAFSDTFSGVMAPARLHGVVEFALRPCPDRALADRTAIRGAVEHRGVPA